MDITKIILDYTGLTTSVQFKIYGTLFVMLIMWVLKLVGGFILTRRIQSPAKLYRWHKVMDYLVTAVGFIIIARVWFAGVQAIATFLGLLSAGIAFALKDPLVNLAAWGFIMWRKPFTLGDRIQLGPDKGDVIDIRLFAFTLMEIGNWVDADQSTGRIIHIPNGKVFTEVLANYNRGFQFVWNELAILITYESDWKKAQSVLEEVMNRHALALSEQAEKNIKKASRKMMIFYNTLTPSVYLTIEDSGVKLVMRYLCPPKKRRDSAHAIYSDILTAFAEADDIDFAYPTQRMYFNPVEGKADARAELTPRVPLP